MAPACKDNLCNCSGYKRLLYYRDEMVGTQLVAGAIGGKHGGAVAPPGVGVTSKLVMALRKIRNGSETK